MKTYEERRIDILARRMKARTRHDGTALPGYEQNVASIRAEIESLAAAEERVNRNDR